MMSTNTKGWLKLAKEPSGLLTVSVRHFDNSTCFVVTFNDIDCKNYFAARCSRHATERIPKKSLPSRRSSWTTRKKGYLMFLWIHAFLSVNFVEFHVCFVVTELLVFFAPYVQFPITALREIKILQLLKHENVVNLLEICRTKGKSCCPPFAYVMCQNAWFWSVFAMELFLCLAGYLLIIWADIKIYIQDVDC